MPSSTSSFERRVGGRPALLAAACLLLVFEIIARRWRPDGTIPYAIGSTEYFALDPELEAFGAKEVSIVGDSRSREAILAPALSVAMTRKRTPEVANYSMSGALAEDTSGVVVHLLRAKPRPRLIVYGVSSRILSAWKERETPYSQFFWRVSDWWRSRKIRGSSTDRYLPQTLQNELAVRSRLFRLREEIYDAVHAPVGRHDVFWKLHQLSNRNDTYPETPMRGGLPMMKTGPQRNQSEVPTPKAVREYLGKESQEPEWPHTYQEAFVDVIASACREAGVPLVLVEVPTSPALRAELPPRAYPGFYEVFDRVSRQYDVPFIRLSSLGIPFDAREFAEVSHLNLKGAQRYTKALAEKLAPLVPGN